MKQLHSTSITPLETYICEIMEAQEAAGLAIAIVEAQGNPLYQGFFGFRDRETRLHVNEDTIFGIASCKNPSPAWPFINWRSGDYYLRMICSAITSLPSPERTSRA